MARLFGNQLPGLLVAELAVAARLGAHAVRPASADFAAIANAGQIKWVITAAGELMVIPHSVDGVELSHAIISAGAPVRAAGEADVAISGLTKMGIRISTHSGHFLSGMDAATNAEVARLGRAAFATAGIIFPQG